MTKYYSSEKLLSMKDLDGLEPSIYMITTNRCAGKTTHFLLKAIELFKTTKRKTALIYRHQYELSSASSIFNSALKIYDDFEHELTTVSHAKGLFYEFLLDGESFAFSLSLSNVDALKKYSPIFTEIDMCIMDEFQKEDGVYLKNEVQRLESLLISIARGGGSQSRPIKMFLLGNNISMLNPYFVKFDINRRFKDGTKFIRGNGWIAEFTHNESASEAIKSNSLFRAFDSEYMRTSADNKKLFKEDEFLEKCTGKTKYLFTIKHDNKYWGVREELGTGKTFINEKHDSTCKNIIVFTSGEHGSNTVMLNRHSFTVKKLKESYELGLLRFSNLNAKNVVYDILAIDFSK
jgi:hypothetical protein